MFWQMINKLSHDPIITALIIAVIVIAFIIALGFNWPKEEDSD